MMEDRVLNGLTVGIVMLSVGLISGFVSWLFIKSQPLRGSGEGNPLKVLFSLLTFSGVFLGGFTLVIFGLSGYTGSEPGETAICICVVVLLILLPFRA